MKTNILYVGLFVLVVIIIFIIAFGKDKSSEMPVVFKENQEEVQGQASLELSTPNAFSEQVITVIRPTQRADFPLVETRREDELLNRIPEYSYKQTIFGPAGETRPEDTQVSVSAVTKARKYLTEEEVKDMNSKGIVLY